MKFKKNKHGGNYVLDGDGFFISYNPNPGAGISSFAADNGGDETALCAGKKDSDIEYRILNGDFRAEYEELVS